MFLEKIEYFRSTIFIGIPTRKGGGIIGLTDLVN
jgi:hypothetical protein